MMKLISRSEKRRIFLVPTNNRSKIENNHRRWIVGTANLSSRERIIKKKKLANSPLVIGKRNVERGGGRGGN